ncbi:conserved exported hypothetical protein [Xenorhabdus bovienii str. Jollieti]|nr:DUF2946 domain-containing protein [Xenorhabdus bovienii]CDH27244.1 conserved exported hypothetical protein [Xenorhabdus bovienii str. Jollieti]
MLSLFRLSQRRIPALIASLAILMLFIGPVVSKTLEHRRDSIKSEAHHNMPMSGMQNSNNHHYASSVNGHDMHHGASHTHTGLMDDIACGYCQLLINLPLLTWVFIPFIWLALTISRTPPVRFFLGSAIQLFYGESQPRAPPLN